MRKVLLFLVTSILCFSGPAVAQEGTGPAVLKVKGLYVDMNMQEAQAALMRLFSYAKILPREELYIYQEKLLENYQKTGVVTKELLIVKEKNRLDTEDGLSIVFDENEKAMIIDIKYPYVNTLFSSTNMEATEFVQAFMQGYGIQEMKATDDGQGWFYTNPSGYKVVISTKKDLTLVKVADTKKSFN